MMIYINILLLITLFLCLLSNSFSQDDVSCITASDIQYANNGIVSFTQTFIKCLQNINDPLLFPGYFYDIPPADPLQVYAQIALNNLVSIDEIHSTITLDFFFRLYWIDNRLSMPALWDVLPIELAESGIDLSQLLNIQDVQNGTQPGLWLPDIYFPDCLEANADHWLIRIRPKGSMEWSRHYTATFIESTFDYKEYPSDKQQVVMRFSSYGLNASYLVMNPSPHDGYVVLFKNYYGAYSFTNNPIWKYDGAHGETWLENNGMLRTRSTGVVYVQLQRKSVGLVIRLAFPIFLLVVLAGLVFWAPKDTRVDATVNLLLAVSALYIVVFQNIPMLGYLTTFDNFVLYMFALLFACAFIHGVVERIGNDDKIEHWPLRLLLIKLCEFFGKVSIIPICIFMYFLLFSNVYPPHIKAFGAVSGGLFFIIIFVRDIFSIKAAMRKTKKQVYDKIDNVKDYTVYEMLFYNIMKHKKFSFVLDKKKLAQESHDVSSSSSSHNNNDAATYAPDAFKHHDMMRQEEMKHSHDMR